MDEQDPLELTNEQLVSICQFAERVHRGEAIFDAKQLAFCLQAVALCLHRVQVDEPDSPYGQEMDEWYDTKVSQNVRMMWLRVKPVAENLKAMGFIQ